MTPFSRHPLAIPFSPSGCTKRANAAGLTKTGIGLFTPRSFVLVSTFLTSRSTRGRNQIRSNMDRFASRVIRSVAADE